MNMITILIALFSLTSPMSLNNDYGNSDSVVNSLEDDKDQNQKRTPAEWETYEGG